MASVAVVTAGVVAAIIYSNGANASTSQLAANVTTSSAASKASSASAGKCSDIDISFARGTLEPAGLGSVGTPFVQALTAALAGKSVSSYAVNYAAAVDQSSAGPGGTAMTKHVTKVAAACPKTRFVLGGYSQGAAVTDVAVGVQAGGTKLPAKLSSRVAAVVVFGNPLGLRHKTIATASTVYGPKSRDFCDTGDPVCGNGTDLLAHLGYSSNGTTKKGATFAADLIKGKRPPKNTSSSPTSKSAGPKQKIGEVESNGKIFGDIDGSGTIDAGDVVALGRGLLSQKDTGTARKKGSAVGDIGPGGRIVGDIDGDGDLDANDVLDLAHFVLADGKTTDKHSTSSSGHGTAAGKGTSSAASGSIDILGIVGNFLQQQAQQKAAK